MEDKLVEALAADIARRIAEARESLSQQMHALGLKAKDGWRVTEEIRHTIEGTQWVFRPVHLREHAPEIEATVSIDHSGRPL